MALRDTTKLRSLSADKQDERLLDPAFSCEGISGPSGPTSSARAYASTDIVAEFNYVQLRCALILGLNASAKRLRPAKLVRRIGANITPVRHALSQLVPADAVQAGLRSEMVIRLLKPTKLGQLFKGRLALELPLSIVIPRHLISDCAGFKGFPEVSAFLGAMLELSWPSRLGMHVGRIWSCIGPIIALMTVAINRLRCLHELSGRKNRESWVPYHQTIVLSEILRIRETAIASRCNGMLDGSSCDDVWLLRNRLRHRQQYLLLRRAPLCVSGAVGSPDTTVTTI